MKKTLRTVAISVLLFSSAPFAFAASGTQISVSDNSPVDPQPFAVFCAPYSAGFTDGGYYIPNENSGCTYALPAPTATFRILELYQGSLGNATLVNSGNTTLPNTILFTSPNFFNGTQDEDFFFAAYSVNTQADLNNMEAYLTQGGSAPAGIPLNTVSWKYGIPPVATTTPPGDTIAPIVTINTPTNGSSFLQNDTVFAMASTSDNVGVTATTYTLDGTAVDPTLPLPFASVPQGSATLVVAATDAAGNTGYATSTFTILPPDLTAPTITITNPTNGATYTDTAGVFVTATISDASAIAATSYTFNGATIDPSQPLPLLGAPLGPATVSVAATDVYGNASSSTVNFVIRSSDVTGPSITITNPIAGHTYLSTDTVLAAATISDPSGVSSTSYVLDGMTIDSSQPLPLAAAGNGPATLTVNATDAFGNTSSSSVSFIVSTPPPPDTTAPTITIVSPMNGKKYSRDDRVSIVANITDSSPIANTRYLFNGKQVDPAVMLDFSKAPLGTNTLVVVAVDSFGNKGTATSTFRILPGNGTCIADVTEAFDQKWFANKNVFKTAFEDCQKITNRGHDRDNYRDDDNKKNKNCDLDDRYIRAQSDVNDALSDIDSKLNY